MRTNKLLFWICLAVLAATVLLAQAASQGVTLAAEVWAPTEMTPTIVIDPGHGGEDGGAVSCSGVPESEINLAVGKKLDFLLRFIGIRTRMTRAEDISLHRDGAVTVSEKKISDLRHRVEIVAQTRNPILISIHQNMFSEERYAGAQVFYADWPESLRLAELTQTALREGLDPGNHREIKKSLQVYLMNKIQCPGILVECGFLSNQAEERKLRNENYQRQLACAIASGLTAFLTELSPHSPE